MSGIVATEPGCPGLPSGAVLLLLTGPPGMLRSGLRPATREHLARMACVLAGAAGGLREGPRGPLGTGAWSGLAMSIAYAGRVALLGVARQGRIGVDLAEAVAPPEWRDVAALYLGAMPTSPDLFAHAWAAHEAMLKCRGLALTEHPPEPPGDRLVTLTVRAPAGLVGAVCLAEAAG